MTYSEIKEIVKKGNLAKLPYFEGYFRWNYNIDDLEFFNKDFICPAKQLNV